MNVKKSETDNKVENRPMILRDFLAVERTKLANERTFFAYIRTSLYLILAAIAFFQIDDFSQVFRLGYFCLGMSALLFAVGIIRYMRLKKKLKTYYTSYMNN